MGMRRGRGLLSVLLGIGVAGGALAAGSVWNAGGGEQELALSLKPNPEHAVGVYEVCAACHMPEGWGTPDGVFPQLAGQHRNVLIKQLADIRAGNRDNPTMYLFSTDGVIGGAQSISDVADYISRMPMNPRNGKGAGTDLAHGEALYRDNCVRCHGERGEGSNDQYVPRIQGQHYEYMLRQFRWIRDGRRRNANPDMVRQIANFNDRDTAAVIDYVSRLPPPREMVAPSPAYTNPDFR